MKRKGFLWNLKHDRTSALNWYSIAVIELTSIFTKDQAKTVVGNLHADFDQKIYYIHM